MANSNSNSGLFVLENDTWAENAHTGEHPVLAAGLVLAVVERGVGEHDNRVLRVQDSDANEFFILEVQS